MWGVGEGECELSSNAEETVKLMPGFDGGHTQVDEGSLAESTPDTLTYWELVKNMYKKEEEEKESVSEQVGIVERL